MRITNTCLSLAVAITLCLSGCGGTQQPLAPLGTNTPEVLAAASWLATLPVDALQPWETLSAEGYVIPPGRNASGINDASEFAAGEFPD